MQSRSTPYPMVGRVCLFSFFALFGGRPAAQCFGLQKTEKFHNQSGMVGTASGGMGQV